MLINADHRPWIVGTAVFTVAISVAYGCYVAAASYGPSGGSWPGLFFGVTGTIFMILAGLLAARKKVRTWRVGSAQLWMRMHIWLSLMAIPCIWFHSGFGLGGPLTTALMAFFYLVIASGIVGLTLQQFVPATMTRRVPLETIHGQIDHVVVGLAVDAYELVASVAGPVSEAAEEQEQLAAEAEMLKRQPGNWKQIVRQRPAEDAAPHAGELKAFYLSAVRPYLEGDARRVSPPNFQAILLQAPEEWRGKVVKLQAICEEARQLAVQRRLHAWMHNWLLVHAPLSLGLFVLAGFHAVFALRY